MTTREVLEARRERVKRLLRKKRTPKEIEVVLNAPDSRFRPVSRASIGRDAKAVRAAYREKLLGEGAEDFYAEASEELDEIARELWTNYIRAVPPTAQEKERQQQPQEFIGLRSQILMGLSSISARRLKLGQSLGLVVKEPERIELTSQLLDDIKILLLMTAQRLPAEEANNLRQAMEASLIEDPKLAKRLELDLIDSL